MHRALLPDGGDTVEVIIHLPHSKGGQKELAKRIATAHAQLIHGYISRMDCPSEQKIALLNAIQKSIHNDLKKESEG